MRAESVCRLLAAALLVTAAAGCSSEDGAPADGDAPWVDVGHGEAGFIPLEDGDPVEMVFGPQGRWHIELASHFGGTEPDDHVVMYRVWDLDKTEQIAYPARFFITPDAVVARDDGTYEQVGIRGVFAIDSADEVAGQEWLVEVELIVDADVYVDERIVLVVDEEP